MNVAAAQLLEEASVQFALVAEVRWPLAQVKMRRLNEELRQVRQLLTNPCDADHSSLRQEVEAQRERLVAVIERTCRGCEARALLWKKFAGGRAEAPGQRSVDELKAFQDWIGADTSDAIASVLISVVFFAAGPFFAGRARARVATQPLRVPQLLPETDT